MSFGHAVNEQNLYNSQNLKLNFREKNERNFRNYVIKYEKNEYYYSREYGESTSGIFDNA